MSSGEIVRHDISVERIRQHQPHGLILSGGPSSVYDQNSPQCDPGLFQMGIPVLGICYGMQLACDALGGEVQSTESREYGRARLSIASEDQLFAGVPSEMDVWMSHGDQVSNVSEDFIALARTESCTFAAVRHRELPVFGTAVPPGSHPHPAGWQAAGELPALGLQLCRHMAAGRFC